jgi:transcriptional regulator with XRE-family HTH domain
MTKQEFKIKLDDAIKKRRTALNMRQCELARLVGVAQPMIVQLEKGRRDMNSYNLWRLMSILGMSFLPLDRKIEVKENIM